MHARSPLSGLALADAPACDVSGPHLRLRWSKVVPVATALGVLSGLRLWFTYGALGVRVTLVEGLTSGLLDWWLWIPLVPVGFLLARRGEPARGRPWAALAVHLPASVLAALVHHALFSALSGVIRMWRFDMPYRFSVASPLAHLAPAIATYWVFVVAFWWQVGRTRPVPEPQPRTLVAFRAGRRDLFVRPDEVDWVAAEGNYLELHGSGATHLVRETLKSAHAKLGPERFLRIHRSTLVRRAAVATLSEGRSSSELVLIDGTRLCVGRAFRGALEGLRAAAVRPGVPGVRP